MTSIYIITNDEKTYKIGIFTGTQKALMGRYITYHPNAKILLFTTFSETKTAPHLENLFKKKYKDCRSINSNNNLSEWFTLTPQMLEDITQHILAFKGNNSSDPQDSDAHTVMPSYTQYMNIYEIQDLCVSNRLVVGEYQRPLNKERLCVIKASIMHASKNPHVSYIPPIVVSLRKGIYSIIDGQHRVAAASSIVGDDRTSVGDSFKLEFRVFRCDYGTDMCIFRSINQSRPCPLMYLQEEKKLEHTTQLANWLKATYPKYVKESTNPRVPSFKISSIISEMCKLSDSGESYIVEWFSSGYIKTETSLQEALYRLNDITRQLFLAPNGIKSYNFYGTRACKKHTNDSYQAIIKKITKLSDDNPCYLGVLHPETITMYLFKENTMLPIK